MRCKHFNCYQCDDEDAMRYRELLVDVAREIDQLGCNLIDIPKLVKQALKDKYEQGLDIGSQP